MKIKLFSYYRWDATTLEDFEKKIDDFMATVQVVDVKYSEATNNTEAITGVAVLYK
jgi:hypothetical protein